MFKIIRYFVIILLCLFIIQPIFILADGGNGYQYTRDSILNNDGKSTVFDINSADYLFEHGIELIRATLYDEAISKFLELRMKFPKELVSRMSYIYEGISLVRKSVEENNLVACFDAIDKFYYIISEFEDFKKSPSEDLTLFYIELSNQSRKIDAPEFVLKGYLEYSLIFFDENIKENIYPEIANLNFLRGNFYSAIALFEKSKTYKSKIGLAKSYAAIGEINKSIEICEKIIETVNGQKYKEVNDYLYYLRALKKNAHNKNMNTPQHSIDANGNIIPGNYYLYAGAFQNEEIAYNLKRTVETYLDIDFDVKENKKIYIVLSNEMFTYGKAKIMLEQLISKNCDKAFMKNSF